VLKRAGFAVDEIEAMEYRQQITLIDEQIKKERFDKIEMQLLIAEAINQAYVGSQPPAKRGDNRNVRAFRKWREKKIDELYPREKPTIWENLGKKGSIKIN